MDVAFGVRPFVQEMEQLKSSLEAKTDLQTHREHLRSKLATRFKNYCSNPCPS